LNNRQVYMHSPTLQINLSCTEYIKEPLVLK
jgi:hypothetical protein